MRAEPVPNHVVAQIQADYNPPALAAWAALHTLITLPPWGQK